jgi:hypothetical protein
MKITTIGAVRRMIREALIREFGEPTAASGTDPTSPKGFYDYEIERGADIHGFWYKSPGRPMGEDGDPYRAKDAAAYIGMKAPEPEQPGESPEGTGDTESSPPVEPESEDEESEENVTDETEET